jgi:hypothetical protein
MSPNCQKRFDEMFNLIEKRCSTAFKLTFPRHIVPPSGYVHPRYLGANLFGILLTNKLPTGTVTNAVLQAVAWSLIEWKVPTFFVSENFMRAIVATEPPSDMTLSELRRPFPAMAFGLPSKFMQDYVGRHVHFLSVANIPKAILWPKFPLEAVFSALNETIIDTGKFQNYSLQAQFLRPIQPVVNEKNRIGIYWADCSDDIVIDYAGSYPLEDTIQQVIQSDLFLDQNLSEFQSKFDSMIENYEKLVNHSVLVKKLTPEEDLAFNQRMNALAIRLLLAMSARPDLVETGKILRAARVKHGRERDELWSPNFIGKNYQLRREIPAGTHASPRMHFRRGHHRHHAYGPGRLQRKLIWIEPVLVNAEAEN